MSTHRWRSTANYYPAAFVLACGFHLSVDALVSLSHSFGPVYKTNIRRGHHESLCAKRRNKNEQSRQDIDQFNRWYDRVGEDATPDNVFWDEMERQRTLSNPTTLSSNSAASSVVTPSSSTSSLSSSSPSSPDILDKYPGIFTTPNMGNNKADIPGIAEERSVEATLASFAQFMVSDNWLDEKYLEWHGDRNLFGGKDGDFRSLDEQNASLDQDMYEWQLQGENEDVSSQDRQDVGQEQQQQQQQRNLDSINDLKRRMNMFAKSNEPWDYYEKELLKKQGTQTNEASENLDTETDIMDEDDDLYEWKIRIDPQKGMDCL